MASILNGLNQGASGLVSFASKEAADLDAQNQAAVAAKASLLNGRSAPGQDSTPQPDVAASPLGEPSTAASTSGPRMPAGVNPYGTGDRANTLWLAEQSIAGPESGGNASAQNPVSSAGGLFQITNNTWDAAAQKLGIPAATSDAERDAQKYQPDLNTRVMRLINTQAADELDANHLPVTVQTLQAAHRLGPSGAVTALKAAATDPDAPLVGNGLSPDAVKGNGDVAKMTVGQFLAAPYPGGAGSKSSSSGGSVGSPAIIGDSIASQGGLGGSGTVGAGPMAVLSSISDGVKNGAYKGRDVVLSTGTSNNPDDLGAVAYQLSALKRGDANKVTVMGVGPAIEAANPGTNEKLQKLAQAYGASFVPLPSGQISPDGVHPTAQGYAALRSQVGAGS